MEDSQRNIAAALSGKSRKAKERKKLKKLSLPLSPDISVARVNCVPDACLPHAEQVSLAHDQRPCVQLQGLSKDIQRIPAESQERLIVLEKI